MKCKISQRVFDASGKDEDDINATLNWILGYFSQGNRNRGLILHLIEDDDVMIDVEIDDSIISSLDKKFMNHSDSLISTVLAISYGLGGAE